MRLWIFALGCLALSATGLRAGEESSGDEEKIIQEVKVETAKGNYDLAFARCRDALKTRKDSLALHQAYGLALFTRAQKLLNDTAKKLNEKAQEMKTNPAKQREYLEARSELDKLYANLADAANEYQTVLRLLPDHKNLDAAGHIALCNAFNSKTMATGKTQLAAFLKEYKYVTTHEEEEVYRLCEAVLEGLSKAGF